MQIHWRFAKNAIANLSRGSLGAVVALLLPPILVRHMTPAAYAVWVLVLQTAGYITYLNFGLQTAIGRYVAYANERGDREQRDSVFSTALLGLCIAGLLSLVFLGAGILAVPAVFPSVPAQLISQMRWALLLVGLALAIELPVSSCNGVFIGMERFEIPALTGGFARMGSAIGLVLAALTGKSLIVMAAILCAANCTGYVAQVVALRRVAPDVRFRLGLVKRSTARELSGYCFGLTVMSFSMLLITGFDLLLVGRFEFSAVTPYSVSATLVTLLSGGIFAIVNVLLPHAASLRAQDNAEALGKLVVSSTQLSVLILVLTGIPVFVFAGPILHFWIGLQYVELGAPILQILVVANIIRLIGAPYSVVLVAAGQQNYIKVSPLAEGISNFIFSVLFGLAFGAVGVAFGTLLGAVVSLGSHFGYSMPRTYLAIKFSRRRLLVRGVLAPLFWTSPLVIAGVASWRGLEIGPLGFASIACTSLAGAGVLLFRTQRVVPRERGA